ncbi:Zn(2)-C6 fungal-type domain-containing protein [Fusarium sp. Ph1]|nr:Zn(2)-C6 fungal-type domain-containing protein [Fusarium sp. Ph1]
MLRPKGRNITACYDCHRQKVKCSGEQPCQRCATRQKPCLYPKQDTIVPVPESYLQRIDRSLNELTEAIRSHTLDVGGKSADASRSQTNNPSRQFEGRPARPVADSMIGNSTSEAFVLKLRETGSFARRSEDAFDAGPSLDHSSPQTPLQGHARMRFDTFLPNITFQLPPYSYAMQLMTRAEQEFGDYHTFLRKEFWKRFHATYRGDECETNDRNWLCRLSLVLALAEANTTTRRPIQVTPDDGVVEAFPTAGGTALEQETAPILSAGVELFEQGLILLKVAYEEPTVDDVEALNLASHCSHILNRRMSAYSYAGQSIRIAHCLGLDRPAPASLSNLEREHRKRVWWTAFCVDRAISTELGLRPAYVGVGEDLDYPSSSGLTTEEQEEFYDPDLLTAQIKLCEIKCAVVDTVSQLKSKDIAGPYQVLGQCLQRLDRCGREMPEKVFAGSDSMPERRICASIALRFHQCYILLLRPVLLYQFTFLLRTEAVTTLSDELCTVNNICLHAARSNAFIMLENAQSGNLVNYGYWDSAHLFSCLSVLAIAGPMLSKHPNAFQCTGDGIARDAITYRKARNVLVYMAQAGNLASKRHLGMLEEVERDGIALSAQPSPVPRTWNDTTTTSESRSMEVDLGFEDWPGLMAIPDSASSGVDPFSLP